jgi:O-antigen ligase
MPINLRALIVVLVLSSVAFKFAKSTALLFSSEQDFARRRNLWYLLTVTAFLSPSIWLYVLIVAPFLIVGGRKDSNPSALYLFLLHAVPPVATPIPLPGGAKLIDVSNQILLSLCVIVPAIGRLRRSKKDRDIRRLQRVDWCFLAYGVLTSILYIHLQAPDGSFYPSTFSDALRRMLTFLIAVFAPYFLIGRTTRDRPLILDSLAAFALPCVVMAVIGVFEGLRAWLLYEDIPQRWELAATFTTYLLRGSSLRAMASTGHPLALGYELAIAFGLWLCLEAYVESRLTRWVVRATLGLGLIASYSRGPWACALGIYVIFVFLKPRAVSGFMKSFLGSLLAVVIISLTPLAKKIADVVPFFGGQIDYANIDYRQRLWSEGWIIVKDHPILGDQYALARMQDLRQGQGIVDFVNGYLAELLATGFVGLTLFLFVVLAALKKVLVASRAIKLTDQRFGMAGASLASCILGTLFLSAFGGPDPNVLWALVALAIAYSHLGTSNQTVQRHAWPGSTEPIFLKNTAR